MTDPGSSHALPRVTAVVPTHDRPEMLARAVRAVLEQRYPGHIECVVVFDKAEPVPIDVVVPDGARSLVVVANTRTPGLAGARNTGVLASTGDLVGFCDDDDEWLPGKVEQQVRLMSERADVAVCATGILIGYQGRDIVRRAPERPTTFTDFLRSRQMEINPCTVLVRREAFLGPIGLVDEEVPGGYGEDYEWLLRASRLGPVVSVPEPLVRVNWHSSSFFVGRWRTVIDGLSYILAKFPEFQGEPAGLARIEGQIALSQAALGERAVARRTAWRALRRHSRTKHAYAALAVSTGLVDADRVVLAARRWGRGV